MLTNLKSWTFFLETTISSVINTRKSCMLKLMPFYFSETTGLDILEQIGLL